MAGSLNDNEAFREERQALLEAQREVKAARRQDNDLLSGYRKLCEKYEKLLREMRKVLHISDTQGLALFRLGIELSVLLDNANQGFLTIDRSLKVQKPYSRECRRIFGRPIGGIPLTELMWPQDPEMRTKMDELLRRMLDLQKDGGGSESAGGIPDFFERDGMRIRIECKPIGTADGADEPRIMIILTDTTEQVRSREQLEFLSTHDPLTGLFNRNYAERWLSEYRMRDFAPLSMIVADMNGLKLINDVFGHLQGDEMLVRACSLIRRTFGEDAVAARWGGDEFLVLLPGVDEEGCARQVELLEAACARTEASPIQISMAIGSATMTSPLEDDRQLFLRAEKMMYKTKLAHSRDIRKKLIREITDWMYKQGIEDRGHVERIARLAEGLAERLHLPSNDWKTSTIGLLAQLHDVGKIAIPREAYRHGGKLDSEQWELIRTHSEIGYRLAYSLGEPALAEAILSIHENWDGSGYPYGLQGEQIPMLSRLIAVVDAYDVMIHDQSYRPAMSREAALEEIGKQAGSQFDPRMARTLVVWQQAATG